MEIRIIEEAGHKAAVTGMKFSHQTECNLEDITEVSYVDTSGTRTLASKDKGHNKFLESIKVWLDMRAPLYFWKQFDTYRIGITKQSKSTMHSLMKRSVEVTDFTGDVYYDIMDMINADIAAGNFDAAIANLPDGYLQTKRICCSYKTIRHIIQQRKNHKLFEWQIFCEHMLNNLEYPRLLGDDICLHD